MWIAVTWCLALAILALGVSAMRSAWKAPDLATQDRLATHYRWHRRGWIAAILGTLAAFASSVVALFPAVADADPSQKATVLQDGIDATISAPSFAVACVGLAFSAAGVVWLGFRHGQLSKRPGA